MKHYMTRVSVLLLASMLVSCGGGSGGGDSASGGGSSSTNTGGSVGTLRPQGARRGIGCGGELERRVDEEQPALWVERRHR